MEFPSDRNFCRLVPLDADSDKFKRLMEDLEGWQEIDEINLKIWRSCSIKEIYSSALLD
jgi:hypothetical protein